MIVARYRNAKPLSSLLATKEDSQNFANTLLKCKSCTIVYFEDGIKSSVYNKGSFPIIKEVGEMERKNLPFILLIDRKCDIYNRLGSFTTIVNANCLTYDTLYSQYAEETKEKNKSKLFDDIFSRFVKEEPTVSFNHCFTYFLGSGGRHGLITKDLLFIVMSENNGEIFNGNRAIGWPYDDGKVWVFNEDYDYEPSKVDMKNEIMVADPDKLEQFSTLYEGRCHIGWNILSQFNEEEILQIIRKYPVVFSDFVKYNYACAPRKPFVQEEKEVAIRVDDTGDYFEGNNDKDTWDDIIDEYKEDNMKAPKGHVCCYMCSSYVRKEETEYVTISGLASGVRMCADCIGGTYE